MEDEYKSFTFSQWAREGERIALIGNNIFNLSRLLGADGSRAGGQYRGQGDLYWFDSESELNEELNTMMHTHEDFTEIVFIRKGAGKTRIGRAEYLINKGDAIVIPPHTPHACMPLFCEYTGEHFTDYVNRLRINEAVRLLINTDAAIEDIGPMLGYASKPFFYRMFRQFTGLTPGEMRKRAGTKSEKES